ncbi:MAG TPA: TlyA family RNA methyltransferase [Myxococcales bacterium]|nr:TlyA family RNA methyltransferase [Myxococcales bacterium]
MKKRIDLLLVERGLAPTRAKAQALILAGQVVAGEERVEKAGQLVDEASPLRLKGGAALRYVSRGGLKLEAALDRFGIDPAGLVCADLGASTGGFTDCLLQRGAARVHACDVGRGQLDPKVANDPRVRVHDKLNVRAVSVGDLGEPVDLVTADLSFISLTVVLPAIAAILKPGGRLVALVKPQFEAGRAQVGKGGVVRDAAAREAAIAKVVEAARALGFDVEGTMDAPIKGPAGNLEALLVARAESAA